MEARTLSQNSLMLTMALFAVALFLIPYGPARAAALTPSQVAALEAQIASLQAQLSAATGSGSASVTFTRDLTVGSTGSDVTALQTWLIAHGYSIPAGPTGYFGAETRAAVAAFQATYGITPAVGYFGPITRAALAAGQPLAFTPPSQATATTTTPIGSAGSGGSLGSAVSTSLSAPNSLSMNAGFNNINLSWEAVPNATYYIVQRSVGGGAYTTIASNVVGTTYSDTAVSAGTSYTYTVTAAEGSLESAPSVPLSGSPSGGGGLGTAPVISAIASNSISSSTETITWTTNEGATSNVNYGATTSYGTASSSAALVTLHSITLTGLTASTIYDYQISSTGTYTNLATSANETFTTAAYNYYVDSVNGSNANPGTSPSLAFQNITALPTVTAGQSIGLARGSDWQNQALTVGVPGNTVNNITIAAYGTGAAPVVDASQSITANCWTYVGPYYTCSVTGPGTSFSTPYGSYALAGPWINAWECKSGSCTPTGAGGNDNFLQNVSSTGALVDGSYYIPSMSATSMTIDMIPSDGSNPTSNNYTYTFASKPYSIEVDGTGDSISNVVTKKASDNNGSMVVSGDGNAPYLYDVEADQGGKHNMFVPGGATVVNPVLVDEYYTGAGNALVGFDGTGSGKGMTVTNPIVLFGMSLSNNQVSPFYAHAASGSFGLVKINGGYTKITSTAGNVSGGTGNGNGNTEIDNYVLDASSAGSVGYGLAGCGPSQTCTLNNDQVVTTGLSSGNATFDVSINGSNSVLAVNNTQFCSTNLQRAIIQDGSSAYTGSSLSISSSTFYLESPSAGYKNAIWQQSPVTLSINGTTFDGNTNISNSGVLKIVSGSTYTGDNNNYVSPHALFWNLNAVSYTSLASWQTASGQDTHSTTTGSGIAACTVPAGE